MSDDTVGNNSENAENNSLGVYGTSDRCKIAFVGAALAGIDDAEITLQVARRWFEKGWQAAIDEAAKVRPSAYDMADAAAANPMHNHFCIDGQELTPCAICGEPLGRPPRTP